MRDFAFSLPCERQMMIGDVGDEAMWNEADLTGLTHAAINAGVGAGTTIEESSLAEWRDVMATNLDGAFLTLRASMRAIRASGGGAICLTASVAGVKAEPGIAAYGASKAAVIHLARIAAREGASGNIRVNAIAPGGVETPIWRNVPFFQKMSAAEGEEAAFKAMGEAGTAIGRFAQAGEIAEQITFLLSDKAATMTGACLVSDGGYSL